MWGEGGGGLGDEHGAVFGGADPQILLSVDEEGVDMVVGQCYVVLRLVAVPYVARGQCDDAFVVGGYQQVSASVVDDGGDERVRQ